MTTYAITRDDQSSSMKVRAESDFAARVFAQARGYEPPRLVSSDPFAPHIDTLRKEERERAGRDPLWQFRCVDCGALMRSHINELGCCASCY